MRFVASDVWRRWGPGSRRYAVSKVAVVALTAVALAWYLRVALNPWLAEKATFMPFFLAVVCAAWMGGLWAGWVATVCSCVICALAILPEGPLGSISGGDAIRIGMFALTATAISLISGAMHRARREALSQEQRLRQAQDETLAREVALRRSAGRFSAFMDNSPMVAFIKDCEGRYVYGNSMLERASGRPFDEFRGRTDAEMFSSDDARDLIEHDREVLSDRQARQFIETFRTGSELRRYLVFKFPIDDGEGSALIGGMAIDITEQERVRLALEQSEARFRLLAESIPQLAWSARPDGWIDWFNQRWYEYTGFSEAQSIGWGWLDAHHPDHRMHVLDQWRLAVQTPSTVKTEMTFPLRRADGVFCTFLTKVTAQVDRDGRVVRWFGTNTDISPLQELAEKLREEDRRKDEFLATLAHELRNPLAPIRSGLEVLGRVDDPDKAAQVRDMMDRQLGHMARLLDDLLDVSRISRGKLEIRRQASNLADVLSMAIETSRPQIDSSAHRLVMTGDASRVRLHADPQRLSQVFANLLNNAAKYTERGGLIEIVITSSDSSVRVAIRDSGVGIPGPALPHVFELFSQLTPSLERARGGLGIGLSLVRTIVGLHGGTVTAESPGLGRGSTFTVELPASDLVSTVADAPSTGGDARSARTSLRIVLADDNRDAAASLAMLLKIGGDDVRVAHDGQQALAMVEALKPQAVILDIGMPNLNGLEVARLLRNRPSGAAMLIVAITGWGQEEFRLRSLQAGFDAHLVKPVDLATLEAVLARARDADPVADQTSHARAVT